MKILVHREKAFVGFAVAFDLFLNGEKIGSVRNGEDFELEVSVGTHELACKTPVSGRFKTLIDVNEQPEPLQVVCRPNYRVRDLWPSFALGFAVGVMFLLASLAPPEIALLVYALGLLPGLILLGVQCMILKPLYERGGWAALFKSSTVLEVVEASQGSQAKTP